MTTGTWTRVAAIALCIAAAAVAGCGGGNGGAMPGGIGVSSKDAHATLRILVPQKTTTSAGRRRPAYISPSTAQLAYSIDGVSQTPIALATTNPNCSEGGSGLTCTVPLTVAPGAHTFSFTLEDANGVALSEATNVSYTLVAGSNSTLSVTLGGIATQLSIVPQSDANRVNGSTGEGFQIYGNAAVQFDVELEDADNNVILGAGAPVPSISPSSGAPLTIATPPSSASDVWTLTSSYEPANPTQVELTSFAVTATPYPNSGGNTLSATVALQLYQPWIYVVNDGKVTAYDEQGNLKSVSISSGLSGPLGIAVDSNPTASPGPYVGDLFVTNASANSAGVFLPSGTATSAPGGSFAGLASPGPIVYDSNDDEFYVANTTGSTTMLAFTELGAAASFSSTATVANPTGLAYDPTDELIFLSSYTPDTVTAYTEAGALKTSWTTSLNKPSGIVYDTNNHEVYVTNAGNATVTAYASSGTQESLSGFAGLSTPGPILFDPYSDVLYIGNAASIEAFTESGVPVTLSGGNPSVTAPSAMVLVP